MTSASNVTKQSVYRQLLGVRAFRHLWFGQMFSQLAVNTLLFVLALRVYQNTSSNTAVSALFLAYGVPALLFGLIAGTAVDQLDKRRMIIICDFIRALLALLLLFTSHNIFMIYVIMFINAVITQFYVPSEAPLIPKLTPSHLLVSANSLFSFTYFSSLAIGSIAAGPLLRFFGPYGIFICIAVLFVTASLFTSGIPSQSAGTIGFRHVLNYNFVYLVRRIWTELFDGIRYVTSSKQLFDAIMLLTGTQIILALLGSLGPGFADRIFHTDVRDASLFIVGPAVAGILAGVVWVGTVGYATAPFRLIQRGLIIAGCTLVAIAGIAKLASLDMFWWLNAYHMMLPLEMALFFLLGIANSFLDVPANSILQQKAQGSLRGRVYGMLTAFVGGVGIIPVIVSGVLADTVGIAKVIFILGVGIIAYSAFRVRYNIGTTT